MTTVPPEENSYFLDQESSVEMARLIDQEVTLTRHMGGLLPTDLDLAGIHDLLDVACGPGGWVQEVAFTFPDKRVVGIDISANMLSYARMRAGLQGLANVTFLSMDATAPLKFPDASFDFVNGRLLVGFMWKGAWESLARECFRITRPGGIIRLTEADEFTGITTSPALGKLGRLMIQAFHRKGKSFCCDEEAPHLGLTPMLPDVLAQAGYEVIREIPHMLNYSFGRDAYASHCKDLQIGIKLVQPFLVKAGVATQEELDRLYDQMQLEMFEESFRGIFYFLSVIGRKPLQAERGNTQEGA